MSLIRLDGLSPVIFFQARFIKLTSKMANVFNAMVILPLFWAILKEWQKARDEQCSAKLRQQTYPQATGIRFDVAPAALPLPDSFLSA
jgi:hypothetical protein